MSGVIDADDLEDEEFQEYAAQEAMEALSPDEYIEAKSTEMINKLSIADLGSIIADIKSIENSIILSTAMDIESPQYKEKLCMTVTMHMNEKLTKEYGFKINNISPIGSNSESLMNSMTRICYELSERKTIISSMVNNIIKDEYKDGKITTKRVDEVLNDIAARCSDFDAFVEEMVRCEMMNHVEVDTDIVADWYDDKFDVTDDKKLMSYIFSGEELSDKIYSELKLG